MVTTVLFFGGIAFGSVALSPVENDWGDRLDDIGLLVVGIACLVWYVIGRDRFRRSVVPVVSRGWRWLCRRWPYCWNVTTPLLSAITSEDW